MPRYTSERRAATLVRPWAVCSTSYETKQERCAKADSLKPSRRTRAFRRRRYGNACVARTLSRSESSATQGPNIPDETKTYPKIDRRVVRDIILAVIPKDAPTFTKGAVIVCDVHVGVNGTNSCIRPSCRPSMVRRCKFLHWLLLCPRTRTSGTLSGSGFAAALPTRNCSPFSVTAHPHIRVAPRTFRIGAPARAARGEVRAARDT